MVLLANTYKKFAYPRAVEGLKKAAPTDLYKKSQNDAFLAFKHAVTHSEFYREYVQTVCPEYRQITDVSSFLKHAPLTNKEIMFDEHKTKNILRTAHLDSIKSILLSSGYSGKFSFGVSSKKMIEMNNQYLEAILHYFFQILDKKTLIVNCFQTVKMPPVYAAVAEIGPRIDSLIYLLETLAPQFDQTIIVGDNYLIKNGLEEALLKGVKLSKQRIHLVIGGVYLPENLRTHLAHLLSIDLNDPQAANIFSSMGISEFGLNLFFESRETVALRRLVQTNERLRARLIGKDAPYLPMFFNYLPESFFVEEIDGDLVITNLLDKETKLPFIRYNTRDRGRLITYEVLKGILREFKLENLLPPFKSPLALIYGKDEFVRSGDFKVYPQQVQEGIYSDPEVAQNTTGYFHLGQRDERNKLEIQLKKGLNKKDRLRLEERFQKAAIKYLPVDLISTNLDVLVEPYARFRYGMELDYERKFKYI